MINRDYKLFPPLFKYLIASKRQLMIQETDKKEVLTKLQKVIFKHLNDIIILNSSSRQEKITLDIYEQLMVSALVGDKQVIESLSLWHQSEKQMKDHQKIVQNDLFQWLFSKKVTQNLLIYISIQSKFALKVEEDIKQQKEIKIQEQLNKNVEMNKNLLFDVVNMSESFKLQQIKQEQLNQQNVMLYTDENMMNQLKDELEATPSKTVGGRTHHSEQQQSMNQVHIHNSNKIEHLTRQNTQKMLDIKVIEYQQLHNGQNAALDSQIYGHCLYGDKVEQIIDIFYCHQQQYIIVKWKRRSDGFQPKDTALLSQNLKHHCPYVLISFYQRRFPFLTQ